MKAYVGSAKNEPDSRMPRRFIDISTMTITDAVSTSCPLRDGIAAAAYWAAAEIDTATVST